MRKLQARGILVMAALVTTSLLISPGQATSTERAAPPAPGAERFAGGWAIPVTAEAPAWYTMSFHRKVMAAGSEGVRLPARASQMAVGLAYPGIRPGQWLVTVTTRPIGFAWCSANFVFKKSSTLGLGTAGHCAAKNALGAYPDVTAYVVPPPGSGKLPGFYNIGKFVLSRNNGVGDDFAMISLYPQYNSWVSPTMPVWGGPVGTYNSSLPTVVKHFGHGTAVGVGGTPRAGVAPILRAREGSAFAWYGVGAPGDSGSGVNAALGEAVGNFTHIVIFDGSIQCCRQISASPGEILPGMLAGTTIQKILSSASGWSLVNGSLVPV